MKGRLVRISHSSKCLRGNPLGDPHDREVYVYLPPQYDDRQRFPVVMMLAGFGATHHSIVAWSPWKPNTVELFDRLIVERGDANQRCSCSRTASIAGAAPSFIDSEWNRPLPVLSRRRRSSLSSTPSFEPIPESREARGGRRAFVRRLRRALRLGMDRPERGVGTRKPRGRRRLRGQHASDVDPRSDRVRPCRWGPRRSHAKRSRVSGPQNATEFDAVFVLAAAAAYSPSPSAFPFRGACPSIPSNGRAAPGGRGAGGCEQDPLARDRRRGSEALRRMSMVYVDAGNRDEHGLHFAARMLVGALAERGLPVRYEEYEGGHRGTSWRYEVSLPLIVDALRGPE